MGTKRGYRPPNATSLRHWLNPGLRPGRLFLGNRPPSQCGVVVGVFPPGPRPVFGDCPCGLRLAETPPNRARSQHYFFHSVVLNKRSEGRFRKSMIWHPTYNARSQGSGYALEVTHRPVVMIEDNGTVPKPFLRPCVGLYVPG